MSHPDTYWGRVLLAESEEGGGGEGRDEGRRKLEGAECLAISRTRARAIPFECSFQLRCVPIGSLVDVDAHSTRCADPLSAFLSLLYGSRMPSKSSLNLYLNTQWTHDLVFPCHTFY